MDLWNEYQQWRTTDKAAKAFETGLIGSPDTIRRKLREYADSNIDQIILLNQSGNTSHEDICASLELFAREVMPEFHALEPEHQAWKQAVMSGELQLDDLDVKQHRKLAVSEVIDPAAAKRPSQAQIQEIARNKAAAESGGG